jgi:hypothetical protein
MSTTSLRLKPRLCLNNVNNLNLLTLPFLRLGIECGVDEALPVFVITGWIVRSVVESRITGFFTEFYMTDMSLNTPDTVIVLPAAEKLMKITGCHFLGIFTKKKKKIEADIEELT